ncbi:MAG: hypothetical protein HYR63_05865 [Proteobacteria bacterium]|nr:hypothetical protein [Pseudomonadota bacterium]MBI3498968.1 hypothetical protein [Pseudomonadota bacterium]
MIYVPAASGVGDSPAYQAGNGVGLLQRMAVRRVLKRENNPLVAAA